MAGAISHRILQGFLRSQSISSIGRSVGARAWYDMGSQERFSTIGGDPDTHSDFKPVNKASNDVPSAHQLVEKDVKENPVMLYMKGVPDAPRCGFSALAVKVLQQYGVPFSSRNILEDQELKASIKSFRWMCIHVTYVREELSQHKLKNWEQGWLIMVRYCTQETVCMQVDVHACYICERNCPNIFDEKLAASNWPTFPQVFIKGEFVGGSDIILNMHQSGELKEKFKDLVPSNSSDGQA